MKPLVSIPTHMYVLGSSACLRVKCHPKIIIKYYRCLLLVWPSEHMRAINQNYLRINICVYGFNFGCPTLKLLVYGVKNLEKDTESRIRPEEFRLK